MKITKVLRKMVPNSIKNQIIEQRFNKSMELFHKQQTIVCNPGNLLPARAVSLNDIFNSDKMNAAWDTGKTEIDRFNIPDGTGGVNPGDRRALFYLISYFKPKSVLEVGTHIGASTVHIATALDKSKTGNKVDAHITTVDIKDVNSPTKKPWLDYGTNHSPRQMMEVLKYDGFVDFVTSTSTDFFGKNQKMFDFIFLDGDHAPLTVYQEIDLALKCLNPGGVILLHDFFPEQKPLWSNGSIIPGPFLAMQRYTNEGADLKVVPLGSLPWYTKCNSNVTSLALLMRKSD